MSPAIVRTVFGSCLALGAVDLAWLNLNAARMGAARASSPSLDGEPPAGAAVAALPAAAPPNPVAAARAAASPPSESPVEPLFMSCVVQFDRSRASLRADEAAHLAAIAETMKTLPRAIVRIEGHADRVAWKGNRGDNLTLSDDRASNVVRALIKLGVPADRIRRAAFGDTRPLDDRASEEAYRRNRRVEVRVDPRGER